MSTSGLGSNSVRHSVQRRRTSRWAMMPSTVALITYSSTPRSRRPATALGATLAGRGVGVQGGGSHVGGQGRLAGELGWREVAACAHEDAVGVLAEDAAQGGCERHAELLVDRHLANAVDVVLDRILGGDDLVSHL